jgi:xanthine dehydrogenase small subunit
MHNTIHFICNNQSIETASLKETVLLDFLREEIKLTGTKEGCREGDCGACTVLLGEFLDGKLIYKTVNSCLLPLAAVAGKHVVTIEGLNLTGLTPMQKMFVDEGSSQCGFCTPGFIVSLTGFLLSADDLNFEKAIEYIAGNICRCTGYESIKRSVKTLVDSVNPILADAAGNDRIDKLVQAGYLPGYFKNIASTISEIKSDLPIEAENRKTEFLVSGGTDLFVQKWEQIVRTGAAFVNPVGTFEAIEIKNDSCFIGAASTINDVMNSAEIKHILPLISVDLKYFGSMQIRNRGTVGGNIVNASPIGDFTNMLIALNAKVHLNNAGSKREVYLCDFYKGYKTLDKTEDEIIEFVSFKIPAENSFFNYEKVSRRTYLDIASVNTSILIEHVGYVINRIHISAGGVAPYPLYLKKASEYFIGKELSEDTIKGGIETALAEIAPISDARGSAEYKALLLRQLLLGHFLKFTPQLISVEAFK